MDGHDRLLAAFLAGDLGPEEARRWDEHLLACEACWRAVREDRAGRQAVQLLRQPVPPGLSDRVAFAVEVAAAGRAAARPRPGARSSRRQPRSDSGSLRRVRPAAWLSWRWLAGAAAVAVSMAAVLAALLPGGRQAPSVPAAVAAVARYAQAIPLPAGGQHPYPTGRAALMQVGRQVTVTAGGQRIVLRTWRLGGTEAVVATSAQPFPMPARARGVFGRGMAWSARLGTLGLYCLNGPTSELVAAPLPVAELAAMAGRLPRA